MRKKKKPEKEKEKILYIIVDKREKNSLVPSCLIENGVNIQFKHLKVADYIVGNIGIERKTINDFVGSMINKRLIKQLEELKQYKKQILIIEGFSDYTLYSEGIHENAIRGFILSIILKFKIPIIFTENYEDTAKFLVVLAKRLKRPSRSISLKAKKKTNSLQELQGFVVESFPNIGPQLSKNILRYFKSIKKFINADLIELKKVKKLGEKKAKIIKRIIEEKYKTKK